MTTEIADYEWGVWSNPDNVIHRNNMTEKQARMWVSSWDEEISQELRARNMFSVCKRPRGAWQIEH